MKWTEKPRTRGGHGRQARNTASKFQSRQGQRTDPEDEDEQERLWGFGWQRAVSPGGTD